MRRFLATFVLVATLLIQFHGVTHFYNADAQDAHHCSICETQIHQNFLDATPTPKLCAKLQIITSLSIESLSAEHSIYTTSAHPRAPPVS